MGPFDTPLRAAALGVLTVAASVLIVGIIVRHPRWRGHVLVLVAAALGLVLASEALP